MSRSARSGSRRVTRSRSSGRCRRSSAPTTTDAADRATALFGRSPTRPIRTTTKEAELAKLFTNTWRYMKFAVANQFFMIADQAGVDYTNVLRAIRDDYPRAADLPGPGIRRRPVPVQGHDAARGVHHRPFPDGPGGDAGQRGSARPTSCRRSSGDTAGFGARPSASSAWRSRPNPTTPARRSATSSASSCRGPAPGSSRTDPYVEDDRLVTARLRARARATSSSSARRTASTADLEVGGRDVVDVWGAMGEGIRL